MQDLMIDQEKALSREKPAEVSSMALVALHLTSRAIEASSPARPGHRQHKRAKADQLLVRVRVGNGLLVAKVEDISVGGLFARTENPIPVGAFVEMGLLRPDNEELRVTGVVVDANKRAGIAVRFEGISPRTNLALRRLVLELDPDVDGDVEPTRAMRPALSGRDRELDELRRRIGLLNAENDRLRNEVEAAADAQRLVGRLQMEIERLKARASGTMVVEADLLADIRRDAEVAWVAIARLTDNCDKIK